MTRRVLVIGGAGAVGGRIIRLLSRIPGVELLIAGRDHDVTASFADEMHEARIAVQPVDVTAIATMRPAVVIDASGPFQGRDYAIPLACIAARVPYIDIADDRAFVTGIRQFDSAATAAGVPILSGAGMLPSLSMAAAEAAAAGLERINAVRVWVCPGSQQSHGHAAYASILRGAGQPFKWRRNGAWREAYGWQELEYGKFPGLGSRLLSAWDAPDVALLPERWPTLRDATVHGAAELSILQYGLWALAWLPRLGVIKNLISVAGFAEAAARSFSYLGGTAFGLRVVVEGWRGPHDVQQSWSLVARSGDGVFVPAAPAAALTRVILTGPPLRPGARVAYIGLHEILAELRDRDVKVEITDLDF